MRNRITALPNWAKGLLIIAVLVALALSGVLSALTAMVAFLVLLAALAVLIYRALRRQPLRNWSLIAVAALVLMFLYGGIATARLAEAPQQASSPSDSQEEEAQEQETPAEEAEVQQETPAEEAEEAQVEEVVQVEYDETVRVIRVVDGDTVDISPAVVGMDRVRLIGVDAPETNEPGCKVQPHGSDASRFTTSELQGEEVGLEFDEDRDDRDDRLLAYVY
jgi:endonuclease YncB( thermonuclease family)